MNLLATLYLLLGLTTATSVMLLVLWRRAERDLMRVRRRMARLDELADGVAASAFDKPSLVEEFDGPRYRYDTPVDMRDSGKFVPVGLAFDSAEFFEDEDDFVPPRMTSEVEEVEETAEEIPVLKPGRPRYDTPVGSPQPKAPGSVMEIGSIQVRSDEVVRVNED